MTNSEAQRVWLAKQLREMRHSPLWQLVQAAVRARQVARQAHRWQEADTLRDIVASHDILLQDLPTGVTWWETEAGWQLPWFVVPVPDLFGWVGRPHPFNRHWDTGLMRVLRSQQRRNEQLGMLAHRQQVAGVATMEDWRSYAAQHPEVWEGCESWREVGTLQCR